MLKNLDPSKFLHDQLAFAFSVSHSPVWMDSSTTEYCDKLEREVGGPEVIFLLYLNAYRSSGIRCKFKISRLYRN